MMMPPLPSWQLHGSTCHWCVCCLNNVSIVVVHVAVHIGCPSTLHMHKCTHPQTHTHTNTQTPKHPNKQGGAKVQEALYIYQELGDRFNWTVRLHNGAAVAYMKMGSFEEAEKELLEAYDKNPKDPDTLANLYICGLHLSKNVARYLTYGDWVMMMACCVGMSDKQCHTHKTGNSRHLQQAIHLSSVWKLQKRRMILLPLLGFEAQ